MLLTIRERQIVDSDPFVTKALGTTIRIDAANSKEFGKEIGQYVGSKGKKRSKKEAETKAAVSIVELIAARLDRDSVLSGGLCLRGSKSDARLPR